MQWRHWKSRLSDEHETWSSRWTGWKETSIGICRDGSIVGGLVHGRGVCGGRVVDGVWGVFVVELMDDSFSKIHGICSLIDGLITCRKYTLY